jgi:DNA-directed RNA polymerase subunit omega
MKLVEGFDSNYRYVLVAARRARQIQNGARPVVEPHSRKPCRIAEEELQAGKVKWEIPPLVAKGADDAVLEVLDHPVGGEADD